MPLRFTLKQTGENCEETNSDDRAWRCRYARHSYRFIRETDKQRGLRLRRLSCRLLRIADIALIVVRTAKPLDHREDDPRRLCILRANSVRNSSILTSRLEKYFARKLLEPVSLREARAAKGTST
jgi:hypothetical protein